MLILQRDGLLLGDDGLIEASTRTSVQALSRAWEDLEQARLQQAAQARIHARQLRARALRRGHRAGLALSARRHIALSTALAAAAQTLHGKLLAQIDSRFEQLVQAASLEDWLRPELQRCLAVAKGPLLSVRVAPDNATIARAWVDSLGDDAPVSVMADASLGRTCCVIETATGVVHGRLSAQLAALRDGLRDAATDQIDILFARWQVFA